MLIRCERCSTLYELDESLLAPEGSDVQCARCQHVFRARPARAAGETLPGIPQPEPAAAVLSEPSPPPTPSAPEPHPLPSAAHQAQRYTPAVASYRPPISQPSVSRPPLLRRDTVGTFESRLRWSHRWRWLAPTLFAAVVGMGVIAFLLRESLGDLRGRGAHRAALEIAYRDDLSSLEEARARLDEALRAAPRLHSAEADRALVELLIAGAVADQSLDPGGPPRVRKGESLVAQATSALDQLERAGLAAAEVARARAVAAALGTDRAQVKRLATAARAHASDDPFVQVAEQYADVRWGDRAARDRALGTLSLLVGRRPELIRARYVLARGQALSGRRADALATVEALLRANPRHERALALKESLMRSAPAPAAAAPAAPSSGVRAEKPAPQIRKADSTPGEGAAAASGGDSARTAPPPPPPRPAPRPAEQPSAGAGAPDGTATGTDRAPAEGEPPVAAPRLRPAAVPEPEPVQGGG